MYSFLIIIQKNMVMNFETRLTRHVQTIAKCVQKDVVTLKKFGPLITLVRNLKKH